jgi:hypothetical protein
MFVGARLRDSISLRGDDMCPGDGPERFDFFETGECQELCDIDLVGGAGFRIGDVGEPFQLERNIRKVAVRVRSLLILTSSFATACHDLCS